MSSITYIFFLNQYLIIILNKIVKSGFKILNLQLRLLLMNIFEKDK